VPCPAGNLYGLLERTVAADSLCSVASELAAARGALEETMPPGGEPAAALQGLLDGPLAAAAAIRDHLLRVGERGRAGRRGWRMCPVTSHAGRLTDQLVLSHHWLAHNTDSRLLRLPGPHGALLLPPAPPAGVPRRTAAAACVMRTTALPCPSLLQACA
jgi:hypothetical protein